MKINLKIDWLVQERSNSSALALELRLSCTNPSKCGLQNFVEALMSWSTPVAILRFIEVPYHLIEVFAAQLKTGEQSMKSTAFQSSKE